MGSRIEHEYDKQESERIARDVAEASDRRRAKRMELAGAKRMELVDKLVMVVIDRIVADLLRPGPKPEERECYEMAQELRDMAPELRDLIWQVLNIEKPLGNAESGK